MKEAKVEIKVPEDSQEGTEMALAAWLKKPGDFVKQHDPIAEISTDKAVVEVPAPVSGILETTLVKLDQKVSPGETLGIIVEAKEESTESSQPEHSEQTIELARIAQKNHDANESVTRIASKHGIDLSQVKGTGKGGRITFDDIAPMLPSDTKQVEKGSVSPSSTNEIPSKKVPHDFLRRKIAQRMTDSLLHTAPHVTSVFECDMSQVIQHRSAHKERLKSNGINLTFTAYFVLAAAKAISKVPEVNSRFYDQELEVFEDINIGIGTALEDKGLVVPVIHRAQTLELEEIAKELTVLTSKARDGKLSAEDMSRGTFTISNHGVSGSLFAAPIIIQQPQSAILGVGKLEERVVAIDGKPEVRPRIYVTLTIDHRVLDAHHTNTFLSTFVEFLESFS